MIRPLENGRPLLSVLTFLLLAAINPAVAGPTSRHVLLLYEAEKDLPMNLLVDRQLRATFREKLGDTVALYSEYLDVSRFSDQAYPRNALKFLQEKYATRGLDLMVVVGAPALDPVQLHRNWFFPATPIVFCCVTEAEAKARIIQPGVTGTPAKLDHGPTLALALGLHPGARHVVVIAGDSDSDVNDTADARRDFRPFEGRVEFRYLVGLPMTDLQQEVARLSGDTIIIYLSIFRDNTGKFSIPRDALDQVAQVAKVPIYGYYDSYLGHGIVGGFVASFEIEARNAAYLGLRLLAGEKPGATSPPEATPCTYLFDARQMKRWNIYEGSLPPGSEVRFREPSFWDSYRWYIIGVLSLCAVQAVFILALLVQRASMRRSEKHRISAEDRFKITVETAPFAMILLDHDRRISLVNLQTEQLFGYQREELLGQTIEMLIPERFRGQLLRDQENFFREPHFHSMGEGRSIFGLRNNGTEVPMEISLNSIRTEKEWSVLVVIIDISDRKQSQEKLKASQELQRNLASRLLRAQEVERRRLARELHDDLTQRLAAVAIELDKLEQQYQLPGPAAEALRATRDQMVKLSQDVHALSRQLHPSILDDLGLVDALRSECACFQEREGLTVSYQTVNMPTDLPKETALCLYRIAQEALRNVARHAGTSNIEVSLTGCDGEILLTVSDPGKGFDLKSASSRPGLGLASMEERARLIDADFSIHSDPGKGTSISVLVPRLQRES